MIVNCDVARVWLASRSTGVANSALEESAPNAAHISSCAPCKTLLQRYEAFTDQCGRVLSHAGSPEVEERFLLAAAAAKNLKQAAEHDEAVLQKPIRHSR